MDIYPTIEALLHYANIHLLFDELDYIYARNRIMDLLNLDFYEEYEINDEEIEAMTSPNQLLEALSAYAVMQKVIKEGERTMFERRVMNCVLKHPGEIDEIFNGLSKNKGYEWLYDYGVKSGYVKPPLKRWDGRSTKGKIEVAFNGQNAIETKKSKYPLCGLCRENEGLGLNINMRGVSLELDGENMFFYFNSLPAAQNEAVIVSEYHRELSLNQTSIGKMFDFVQKTGYVIAAREGGHESYSVSSRLLPLNKAPELNKFKSKEYPYIDICTIDWYFGAVRLSCTNREKLIEYTDVVIGKWKKEDANNDVAISVRKIESNYCVEIMFINAASIIDSDYSNICVPTAPFELMGVFKIDKPLENNLSAIEKFVSKEEKFTPLRLEGELKPHGAMINRLLTQAGNSKITPLEASLDVKDEVNRTLEKALSSLNVSIEVLFNAF